MKLDCKDCGARILADDINLQTQMAKCRACNAVFSFAAQFGNPAAMLARPRMKAPRPDGIKVFEDEPNQAEPGYRDALRKRGRVTVVRRWFTAHFIFLIFFCAFWDGILFFWYFAALSSPGRGASPVLLFPLLHVGVGVGLTYYTLAGLINRTTITLDDRMLSVKHGPLPWFGNKNLARDEIQQLYCEASVTQGKNGQKTSYHLSAALGDGRSMRIAEMPLDQVKYLEELLEDRLGIEDMEVPGEVG